MKKGIIMLLLVGAALLCHSCDAAKEWFNPPKVETTQIEEIVASEIEAAVNPVMCTLPEVLVYQTNMTKEYSDNEVFCKMPQDVLVNVATVCLKAGATVTKKEIVEEYVKNRQIYDNLPTQSTPALPSPELLPDSPATTTPPPIIADTTNKNL